MEYKSRCSPGNHKNNSCYDLDDLQIIAKCINKSKKFRIEVNCSKKELYKGIKKIIDTISKCKYEDDWLDIDIILNHLSKKEKNILENNFRPPKPKNLKNDMKAWLSNLDIDLVMKQYSDNNKDVYYYDASPINFNLKILNKCIVSDLCSFNLPEHINNGIRKVCMVFNTDPHYKPGHHWISLYLDIYGSNNKHPGIYYFDSAGNKPPPNIEELINKIRVQGLNNNIKIKYYYNDIQHQKKHAECGVYCLHFLSSMIRNTNFKKYVSVIKDDNYMNNFRNIFYRD